MSNKEKARRLVTACIDVTYGTYVEHLAEIALVNDDDDRLLEHINVILEIMEAAKKEIEASEKDE